MTLSALGFDMLACWVRVLVVGAGLLAVCCSWANGLKCICSIPHDPCRESDHICEVSGNGYCGVEFENYPGAKPEYFCSSSGSIFSPGQSRCGHIEGEVHVNCCQSFDFCNAHLDVHSPPPRTEQESSRKVTVPVIQHRGDSTRDLAIALAVSILALVVLVAVVVGYVCYRRKVKKARTAGTLKRQLVGGRGMSGESIGSSYDHFNMQERFAHPIGGLQLPLPGLDESMRSQMTSGSGGGAAYLAHRTLSREIELRTLIGKGRFGEVHSGVWQGEDVAVKIFYARDESSWLVETEIYYSTLLRHEHILTFYGSDMRSNDDCTELWLVTQYHANGSLFDYLTDHEIDTDTAIKFAYSIASGLNHLHTEIQATSGKQSIAHRDLKSKNILVKDDLHCCIADLGLAVRHNPQSDEPPDVKNHKVGTKRYMSPEMLKESINVHRFNAFRCADIYALGLVLWEIGRRVNINGKVLPYEIPYYDRLDPDPSVEEVYDVVVRDNYRPAVPEHLMEDSCCRHLVFTMRDCWRDDPHSRVTALRVKKTFYDLKKKRLLPAVVEAVEEAPDGIVRQLPALADGEVVHAGVLSSARNPHQNEVIHVAGWSHQDHDRQTRETSNSVSQPVVIIESTC